jgi:hypothetical protein
MILHQSTKERRYVALLLIKTIYEKSNRVQKIIRS